METERRLIDAYKLEELLRSNSGRYHHKDDIIAAIAGQPTVDAVEVVRCKDCKRYVEGHCLRELGGGSYVPFPMKPDDFCSYGERRNDV